MNIKLSDTQDQDFIPILTEEDETAMQEIDIPEVLPLLSLRNTVLFPGVVIPISVGRDRSVRLIKEANKAEQVIGVVSQKEDDTEVPGPNDLNAVGTVARIMKMLKMPDGTNTVILQGQQRFTWDEVIQEEPYLKARVSSYGGIEEPLPEKESQAMVESLRDLAAELIEMNPNIPTEAAEAVKGINRLGFLVNFIGSNMQVKVDDKQRILEEVDLGKRAQTVLELLHKEKHMLSLKQDIHAKVKTDLDQQQREFFLHQQMKTIQDELGANPLKEEIHEKRAKAAKKNWPDHAKETFDKELGKLERMNPQGSEYSVQSNYLDVMLELPWHECSEDNFDLIHAQAVLDHDHHGLEKVKERIIEHLAVLKIKGDLKAPIICLYGPPGVGKTSLGKSVARALNREYVRMSLGGLRDEAEIRGHRKTYIGAMPGRILQSLKKAGQSNPLFVLDEIDKLGRDHHGDPSSAMLEVLDPEQNSAFHDNYLDLDYDLSNVMFIATCNNLGSIQPALRDRMEIIEVTGYTVEEKVQIAKRHLVPKHLNDSGLSQKEIKIPVKTLESIVEQYTNESGVRGLEKRIAKVIRNRAKEVALEESFEASVIPEHLKGILGPSREKDRYQGNETPGVVTGLAWTPNGGDILFIETSLTPGTGRLTLTGNLGDVMKESAMIALEYVKSHAQSLGLDIEIIAKTNVHLHVPQGAIPKDGPSAGITMVSAMVSAFTRKKIRKALAMTGEITLRGQVLPVGGIKEKILAAKRAGIKEIIMCHRNKQDVDEIDAGYLKGIRFTYVKDIQEVVSRAVLNEKKVSSV